MVAKLQLSRQAGHCSSLDRTDCSETLARIRTPRVLGQGLPAVAGGVEDDRMQVDAAASRALEHEARREPRLSLDIVGEAGAAENLDGLLAVVTRHDQVEILVITCPGADERVDAPASVDPEADSRGLEAVEHIDDIGSVHRRPCR